MNECLVHLRNKSTQAKQFDLLYNYIIIHMKLMSSAIEMPRERSANSLRSGKSWVRSASGGYISMHRHGEHKRAVGAMHRHSGGHNVGFGFDNVCIYTLPVARHA